jgi:hypothetical protein
MMSQRDVQRNPGAEEALGELHLQSGGGAGQDGGNLKGFRGDLQADGCPVEPGNRWRRRSGWIERRGLWRAGPWPIPGSLAYARHAWS